MLKISIKDQPILSNFDDNLKVARYIDALSMFICESDTPITIGLQGEWGTGKTSMMYMLREKLLNSGIATSWVNTWEYSMFRGAKETTPAVLNGLLTTLEESCGDKWTIKQETKDTMKKIGRFFGNLINQVASSQLNIDIKAASESGQEVIGRAEIAQIKADITGIINKLITDNRNSYKRVVFFVDDLDRINPNDAVEVLEALKNMFDIPHCIFVLAIDYDVVVKGLESKFGKKTDENEREFRSFFDKIIQVPFSMPVGTYDIDFFLKEKLSSLGIKMDDDNKEFYLNIVRTSVGYNPRSLKRFLNTFSLLNTIRKLDAGEKKNEIELMLFAMLGLQISYPRIFRYITQNPEYTTWNQAFALKIGVDWNNTIANLVAYGENEFTDEEWEKVVWSLCQSDSYLKSRVFSVLELLNILRTEFGNENLPDLVSEALEFAAITSVDDNQEAKESIIKVGNHRIRFNGIDAKYDTMRKLGVSIESLYYWKIIWDKINSSNKFAKLNFAKTATSAYRWIDKAADKTMQAIYFEDPSKTKTAINFKAYGWGNNFFEDLKPLFNEFGWQIDMQKLKPKATDNNIKKIRQIEPDQMITKGLYLFAPFDNFDKTIHGFLEVDNDFIENLGKEKASSFLMKLADLIAEKN
jgi:hypothetical protein